MATWGKGEHVLRGALFSALQLLTWSKTVIFGCPVETTK